MWCVPALRRTTLVALAALTGLVVFTTAVRSVTTAGDTATVIVAGESVVGDTGTRAVLGDVALGEPIAPVLGRLGPPTAAVDDVWGIEYSWERDDGAVFVVVGSHGDDHRVIGLFASVPPGSSARFTAFGGLDVGRSTAHAVTAAWGPGFSGPESPGDDFLVRYVVCAGSHPIVVKFGVASTRWDEPVRSALVAFADELPGARCALHAVTA
jgi:hypothetical protein